MNHAVYPVFGSELFTDCSRSRWRAAPSVTDVKDLHHITLDAEEDSVDVRFSAVQELPNLDWRISTLG